MADDTRASRAAAAGAIAVQLVWRPPPAATLGVSLPRGPGAERRGAAAGGGPREPGRPCPGARAAGRVRAGVADHPAGSAACGRHAGGSRFSVAAAYLPAVEALDVGGDWYDVFALGADRVGVVVGDVVGRGVEAAATMGQLRSAIRAVAGFQVGPALVLQRLDGFVKTSGRRSWRRWPTPRSSSRRARCSTPAPAIRRRSARGRRREPRALGRPVAAAGDFDQERTEGDAQLAAGDALVLYTDGLVELAARASTRASTPWQRSCAGGSTARSTTWPMASPTRCSAPSASTTTSACSR